MSTKLHTKVKKMIDVLDNSIETRKEIAKRLREEMLELMATDPKPYRQWAREMKLDHHTFMYFLRDQKVTSNIILRRIQIFLNKQKHDILI